MKTREGHCSFTVPPDTFLNYSGDKMSLLLTLNMYFACWAVRKKMLKVQKTTNKNAK